MYGKWLMLSNKDFAIVNLACELWVGQEKCIDTSFIIFYNSPQFGPNDKLRSSTNEAQANIYLEFCAKSAIDRFYSEFGFVFTFVSSLCENGSKLK